MLTSHELIDRLNTGGRYSLLDGRALANPVDVKRIGLPTQIHWKPEVRSGETRPLWYAVGGEWLDFAEGNQWINPGAELWELNVRTSPVPVRPRVWTLDTAEKVLEFSNRFGIQVPFELGMEYVDWPTVARICGGVEIAPYQWSLRSKFQSPYSNYPAFPEWYYTWDVASGAIWDPMALRGSRLIAEAIQGEEETVWINVG